MELTILESSPTGLRAGYSCPCGCTPSVAYERGSGIVAEGCCCGNHFVVGPRASSSLTLVDGFRREATMVETPWGEGIEAAWLIGPSVHGPASDAGDHSAHHHHEDEGPGTVIDPVCGMTVDPVAAREKGLHSSYQGRDYFFCGKGCKLEFDEDPERYLDPTYVPSM
jgi:YHS domain-containing protein